MTGRYSNLVGLLGRDGGDFLNVPRNVTPILLHDSGNQEEPLRNGSILYPDFQDLDNSWMCYFGCGSPDRRLAIDGIKVPLG
jgi:hypothetical protein